MGVRGGVRALKDRACVIQQQPDAVISQANPVSTTLYTVLDTTRNVRIYAIAAKITWAVTQPTPLEVVITIDGQSIIHNMINPTSATDYCPVEEASYNGVAENAQTMASVFTSAYLPKTYEGRSVKIAVRVTWAVTQPTPLVCRVKWAKW